MLGWAIVLVERHASLAPVPMRALAVGVLGLALVGIVLMPASGFWLALPPALALCMQPHALKATP